MPLRDRVRRTGLAALVWSVVVAVLLLAPGDDLPSTTIPLMDKAVHAVLFAVHFMLLAGALAARRRGRAPLSAAVLSGLYALALEAAQVKVPGRGWDSWDVVAGVLGIVVAAAVLGWRRARVPVS